MTRSTQYLSVFKTLFIAFGLTLTAIAPARAVLAPTPIEGDPLLSQVGYQEAQQRFRSQKYDSPGVWLCGYSLARQDYSVAPKAPRLLVEIDEHYLYLKNAGELIELTSAEQTNNRVEYKNAAGDMRVVINILKRNNFSEYQESHDRQVEARIEMLGKVENLKLKGQSCGI